MCSKKKVSSPSCEQTIYWTTFTFYDYNKVNYDFVRETVNDKLSYDAVDYVYHALQAAT